MESRWAITMELLPESFLVYVVRAKFRKSAEEATTFYTLLSLAVLREWWDDDEEIAVEANLVPVAMYGIMVSVYAELERRHKHFCDDVIHMTHPLNPDEPPQYFPRDPETFSQTALSDYYQDLYRPVAK